jgi:hypothetical protein
MAIKLHHATVKFLAKHGFQAIEAEGGFRLVRIEDGMLSVDTFASAGEMTETLRSDPDGVEFETEEDQDESGIRRCGVMQKGYHDEYSSNPHGPGCGDQVDVTLRNAIYHTSEGAKTPKVDEATLRHIGVEAGLWKESWNSLNVGMRRMNLANRIRGFLRNNPDGMVTIGAEGTGRWGVEAQVAKRKAKKAA